MKIKFGLFLGFVLSLVAGVASAHVTVSPNQVGVAKFQTFSISVPNEQSQPTVAVRLVLPEGLEHVSPTVKPGWTVALVHGEAAGSTEPGHEAGEVVKEIVWTGGSIPAEFRDDFTFSARVPATATTLSWKAYQTYRSGNTVAWELLPGQEQPKKADGTSDYSQFGPASQTKVVDDLSAAPTNTNNNSATAETKKSDKKAYVLSILALALSLLSLAMSSMRRGSGPSASGPAVKK
jgi:uncharacterized protein YcnI